MKMLAKAYDTETSTLKVGDGVIRIGAELFQRLFEIPPGVDDFPLFDAEQAIRKYQCKHNKSCEGCMFALLAAKELSAMAATIQPEAFSKFGGNDGVVLKGATREDTIGAGLNKEDANHTTSPDGYKKGSDRRESDEDDDDDEPIVKRLRRKHDLKRTPQSCMTKGDTSTTSKTDRIKNPKGSDMKVAVISASVIRNNHPVTFDEDDDNNQPISKRIRIKTQKRKTQQQKRTEGENIATSLPKTSKQPTEMDDTEPKTSSTTLINYL
ncbi:uncharacterized protein DS421_6g189190 [Arachis hypogaea]|nr:uncharacterized protein DS421_6g189190 [Arachis hypogaea]